MTHFKERRKDHRVPFDTKVSWSIDNLRWYEDSSRDISSTGMLLRTEHPIDPGVNIKLSFKIPNLKYHVPIITNAKVARVVMRQGRQVGLGVQFLTLKPHYRLSVKGFVYKILGLPLNYIMQELGNNDTTESSLKMEHLLRDAEAGEDAADERRMARSEAMWRKFVGREWIRLGVKTGLFLLGLFIVFKTAQFILNLTEPLRNLQ